MRSAEILGFPNRLQPRLSAESASWRKRRHAPPRSTLSDKTGAGTPLFRNRSLGRSIVIAGSCHRDVAASAADDVKERRIEAVIPRPRESARTRAVASFGLCFLLLLAGPGRLAAQESASRFFPASADHGWLAPSETASPTRSSPVYRLLPEDSRDHEPWMASADLGIDAPLRLGWSPQRLTETPLTSAGALSLAAAESACATQLCPTFRLLPADSSECEQRMALADLSMEDHLPPDHAQRELPPTEFLQRHRLLFSTLIPITSVGAVLANSLVAYNTNHSFRITHEGFFGPDTTNGGADKASHLTDYFVITNLFQDVYRMLGYSENAAIAWGFGLAVATGFANEVGDGFTRHGFSWEDFAMDAAGATAASLIAVTHTKDLLGMRTSHLPSDTYTHDVYSADLKLSGLGQRLGVNIGPLRWLLVSVTYGTKGYRVQPPIEHQRQLGFEIGLNFQQILNDVGVKRNTWWGYSLHLFADNIRFPFTAVGMRVDVNRGKWHGPNSGNYD